MFEIVLVCAFEYLAVCLVIDTEAIFKTIDELTFKYVAIFIINFGKPMKLIVFELSLYDGTIRFDIFT